MHYHNLEVTRLLIQKKNTAQLEYFTNHRPVQKSIRREYWGEVGNSAGASVVGLLSTAVGNEAVMSSCLCSQKQSIKKAVLVCNCSPSTHSVLTGRQCWGRR